VRKSSSPDWRETFEFSVLDAGQMLTLLVGLDGVKAGRESTVGSIHVPLRPLLDQQPRMKRDALSPPAGPSGAADEKARGYLRYELRFRSTAASHEPAGDGGGGARYIDLVRILRSTEPWLAVALCETTPLERSDRMASALVEMLTYEGQPAADGGGEAVVEEVLVEPMQQLVDVLRVTVMGELEETADETLVFRRNSIATKLATCSLKALGRCYLQSTLAGPVRSVCEAATAGGGAKGDQRRESSAADGACALEVDPERLRRDLAGATEERLEEVLQAQRDALRAAAARVLDAIFGSISATPEPVREVCRLVVRLSRERFGDASPAAMTALSGILFLRLFVPCVAAPSAFSILPAVPPRAASRALTLVSKVVNATVNAASGSVAFNTSKEPFMLPLNDLVTSKLTAARAFLRAISSDAQIPLEMPDAHPSGTEVGGRELPALRELHKQLSEQADKLYESAPTPVELHLLQQTLTELGPAEAASGSTSADGAHTSEEHEWSPETVVSRVVAVKEALISEGAQQQPKAGSAGLHGIEGAPQTQSGMQPPPIPPSPERSAASLHAQQSQQSPVGHSSPSSNLLSMFASRPRQLSRHSIAVPSSAESSNLDSDSAAAAAALIAGAPGLAQSARGQRAHRHGRRGSDHGTGGGDGAGAGEDGERAGRLEADALRRQLGAALSEKEELEERLRRAESALDAQAAATSEAEALRRRLSVAESALQAQTAEVL
jgi:hypothetical protein